MDINAAFMHGISHDLELFRSTSVRHVWGIATDDILSIRETFTTARSITVRRKMLHLGKCKVGNRERWPGLLAALRTQARHRPTVGFEAWAVKVEEYRMQTEASSRWMADVGVAGDIHTAIHVGFRLG